MGQAKRRGTFEERRAQAIERDHEVMSEATRRWAALTKEEKAAYIQQVKMRMSRPVRGDEI